MNALAKAMEAGSLPSPFGTASVSKHVEASLAPGVALELERLRSLGMAPSHLAVLLRMLATEHEDAQRAREEVELVWTGPESPGAESRDTLIVVQELFETAQRRVLMSTFSFYEGRVLFERLGERMTEHPDLRVDIFANIHRRKDEDGLVADVDVLQRWSNEFRKWHWPSEAPLPNVFFDPRTLKTADAVSLHAKCIVIDSERALVTSANFSESAQRKNIEAGVLTRNANWAAKLERQFDMLVSRKQLLPVPGLGG
jgi:phosphatidylserine/phosphatidylglycerophosphate/cardiolipin synthase-like enzyme